MTCPDRSPRRTSDSAPDIAPTIAPSAASGPVVMPRSRTPNGAPGRLVVRALTVLAVLLAAACAPEPAAAPGPTVDDERVADVAAARSVVADSAVALGNAVAALARDLRSVRLGTPADAEGRTAAVAAVRAGPLPDLRAALSAAGNTEIEGDTADVMAAAAAWQRARDAAGEVVAGTDPVLDMLERLVAAEAELPDLVASWDSPGARSQQLARFEETAVAADLIATELAEVGEQPPCGTAVQRRVLAAEAVAVGSRDLRALVAARDGDGFDVRRADLDGDPFQTGTPDVGLIAGDAEDAACWDGGAIATAAARVPAELDAMVAALNPADLERPSAGTPTG